jgi:hypothetical protein
VLTPVPLVPTTKTANGAVIATTEQFATMSTGNATVYRAFRELRYRFYPFFNLLPVIKDLNFANFPSFFLPIFLN